MAESLGILMPGGDASVIFLADGAVVLNATRERGCRAAAAEPRAEGRQRVGPPKIISERRGLEDGISAREQLRNHKCCARRGGLRCADAIAARI